MRLGGDWVGRLSGEWVGVALIENTTVCCYSHHSFFTLHSGSFKFSAPQPCCIIFSIFQISSCHPSVWIFHYGSLPQSFTEPSSHPLCALSCAYLSYSGQIPAPRITQSRPIQVPASATPSSWPSHPLAPASLLLLHPANSD